MTKDEALRLAWDALEDIGDEWGFTSERTVPKRKEAITAIKEVLAQPEQEPVAIYRAGQAKGEVYHVEFLKGMEDDEVLLYATPPQRTWIGLTDEDLEAEFGFIDELLRDTCYRTEAKLRSKNNE
jgi:hypothetical protein